jgi:hypothetical protein
MGELRAISRAEVAARLGHAACIPLVHEAVVALSARRTMRSRRSIIDLDGGRALG